MPRRTLIDRHNQEEKVKQILARIRPRLTRTLAANVFMLVFIILTGIGAFMILPAIGFIIAGLASGLYGYLLGSE